MSVPLCENTACGHERGLHYVTVETGGHGRCVKTGCPCQRFIGPELDKDFGVPSVLRETAANEDAKVIARHAALIELRLLIAAVHDVVLAPAPRVLQETANARERLLALHEMTAHKAAVERLMFSLGNARKAVDYVDRLGK